MRHTAGYYPATGQMRDVTVQQNGNLMHDLTDDIVAGGIAKTYCCDPLEVNGQIHLGFDEEGRLIGVEVLDASKLLPETAISGQDSRP